MEYECKHGSDLTRTLVFHSRRDSCRSHCMPEEGGTLIPPHVQDHLFAHMLPVLVHDRSYVCDSFNLNDCSLSYMYPGICLWSEGMAAATQLPL